METPRAFKFMVQKSYQCSIVVSYEANQEVKFPHFRKTIEKTFGLES